LGRGGGCAGGVCPRGGGGQKETTRVGSSPGLRLLIHRKWLDALIAIDTRSQ
jgi:hypothetical protein